MSETIAVWFSCGAASAVAAKLTLEKYGQSHNVRVINNPVAEEDDDNRRFLRDVSDWLGANIETAINPKYPSASCVDVWRDRKFMSGPQGAPCTVELKKRARQQWESQNDCDYLVLGFTVDEIDRHKRFIQTERTNVLPVLIDAGLTKQDCMRIIERAGIRLPRVYAMGLPNANCIGCVKATSPAYWDLIREKFPAQFNERATQSREIGARLVRFKGERIFLDELPKLPANLSMDFDTGDCGIFCEEPPTQPQQSDGK